MKMSKTKILMVKNVFYKGKTEKSEKVIFYEIRCSIKNSRQNKNWNSNGSKVMDVVNRILAKKLYKHTNLSV